MDAEDRPGFESLTVREREVIALMARGLTNGQIAERLGISFETAKWHVAHIISKTGAATREEAVANWRAWNRPGARAKRWVRGFLGIPILIRVGVGALAVAALAGIGGVTWALLQEETGDPQVAFVADLRAVGSDLEGPTDGLGPYRMLPLDEALDRLLQETGFVAPRSRQLEQRGLLPVFVGIIAGPVLEEGTVWGVYLTYGDGATLKESRSRIDVVRYGFAGHGPPLPAQQWPWGAPSANGLLLNAPVNVGHEPKIGLNPRVYTAWGGVSRFIVRLADRGDPVLIDDSLAISILLDLAGSE